MSNDALTVDSALGGLLARLSPAARRRLARQIAISLRHGQQQRIRLQQNPDGSGYTPRKTPLRQRGRLWQAMFSKIRLARYLTLHSTADQASVAFVSQVERIARVHQEGLTDRVSRHHPRQIRYPARQLLGFSQTDISQLRDQLINHLTIN